VIHQPDNPIPIEQRIADRLLEGEVTPHEMVALTGLPSHQAAAYLNSEPVRKLIEDVKALRETCAYFTASHHRQEAIARLGRMVRDPAQCHETQRRSCTEFTRVLRPLAGRAPASATQKIKADQLKAHEQRLGELTDLCEAQKDELKRYWDRCIEYQNRVDTLEAKLGAAYVRETGEPLRGGCPVLLYERYEAQLAARAAAGGARPSPVAPARLGKKGEQGCAPTSRGLAPPVGPNTKPAGGSEPPGPQCKRGADQGPSG
jgi:hypothetical protein